MANILLPDELGNEEQTACLDITALPLLLIAINLTGDENELLNALCDEALLALAEHLHLGSRNTILRNRIDLMQDVADTLHQQRAGRGEAG